MHSRRTSDYSPLRAGSPEYKAAENARKEMMRVFAETQIIQHPKRKTWFQRMLAKAKGFKVS